MSDHRRGRARNSHRYDDYDDGYYNYERQPRHRSLGRQALDKLESAVGISPPSDSGKVVAFREPSPGSLYSADRAARHHGHHSNHGGSHHGHHNHHNNRRAYSTSPPRQHRRHHHSTDHHRDEHDRSRSHVKSNVEVAMEAAAIEAFRIRKEPGSWTGSKGGRVATAALSAAAIGAASESRNPDHEPGKIGKLGTAIGGLMVNRIVNGPRKEMR
ncbi:hypothetical protein B0T17DRAFT_590682 [Bombardia bombarda]|uniref:Uncharacterized protein n=1 Tax=Bombardia bombarda TaxID=252184 RepID=A0AA39X0A1_9PEZI|nr:hypothetical protein B0T17DRAFT_590682 [Bombardia bombarda]